jgi:hypothetical protein
VVLSLHLFQLKFCIHFLSYHACCLSHWANTPWFHHPNSVLWRVQIKKLFIMQFSPFLCYFSHILEYYVQHPVLKYPLHSQSHLVLVQAHESNTRDSLQYLGLVFKIFLIFSTDVIHFPWYFIELSDFQYTSCWDLHFCHVYNKIAYENMPIRFF